jgi:hypothetical protein
MQCDIVNGVLAAADFVLRPQVSALLEVSNLEKLQLVEL